MNESITLKETIEAISPIYQENIEPKHLTDVAMATMSTSFGEYITNNGILKIDTEYQILKTTIHTKLMRSFNLKKQEIFKQIEQENDAFFEEIEKKIKKS